MRFDSSILIHTLNGVLAVTYLAWAHAPTLLSLLVAALVVPGPDRSIQRVAGLRPRRRARGEVTRSSPAPTIATIVTAVFWTAASLLSQAQVTLWGSALWIALFLGALALPQERENVLWTHKGLILGYGALALGLRILLRSTDDVITWATLVMGVESESAQLLTIVRNALAPWGVLTVWAVYPIGALGLLGQRMFVNHTRLVAPLASVRDTIEALRTRGEISG